MNRFNKKAAWIVKCRSAALWAGSVVILSGCASFELHSNPEGALVYENERSIGTTPYSFTLFSDKREFTVQKEGYVEQVVSISPLDRKQMQLNLVRILKTSVHTVPPGAAVERSVNGAKLGKTSLDLRLAKPESVVLTKKGYEPRTIKLVPNQVYRIELKALEGFREIAISSTPTGVSISNRSIGDKIAETPALITAEEGTEFEFRKEGYRPQIIMVNKRSPENVHIAMVPLSTVTIRSEEGAAVYLAGSSDQVGEVPYTEHIENDRIFEIRKEGYYPAIVAATADESIQIDVPLKKIPFKSICTTPAEAEIFRFGRHELLGMSPLNLLVDSERLIEIRKEGYEPQVLSIGSDSPETIDLILKKTPANDVVVDGILRNTVRAF